MILFAFDAHLSLTHNDAHISVFNIGNYRRKFLGTDHTANFFDPENQEGYKLRMQMAKAAMTDMMTYLQDDKGDVGIYDGTNSTAKRRKWIQSQIETQSNFHLLFIESVCNDEAIIEHNVLATKTKSPDYKHSTPEKAVADFNLRIEMYRKVYEPLGESDSNLSYVQTINAGERLVMNKVYGFLPMKILSFVSNLHIVPRPVMLTRHGENLDNIDNRIGGLLLMCLYHGILYCTDICPNRRCCTVLGGNFVFKKFVGIIITKGRSSSKLSNDIKICG